MSFYSELRKRRLLEIVLLYLGAGWLCIEITQFIVGNYGFSKKILDTVVLLVVLGFPAFLIIGWYHGERGQQRVKRGERWLLVTLMALGGIGTYRIATGEETRTATGGQPDAAAAANGAQPVSTAPLPDLGQRSLAVLPFKNHVADEELAWLGAGLADLLTTNLAQMPDMLVVGRQALYDLLMEAGRSEQEEIPETLALTVARGAGARMLLWGTITGSVEDMRIDVQLVELENGTILFAEAVRGSDVFALVDEISEKLARRLRGEPPPDMMRISHLGTRDMAALGAFQRGVAAERAGRMDEAESHFEEASQRDSTFMLPLVRLASRAGLEGTEWTFEWLDTDLEDLDREDVEVEELAQAFFAGRLTDEQLHEIAVAADFDDDDMAALARIRGDRERRAASHHRRRAIELLERMGPEWASQMQGMGEERFLAKLDSTMVQVLSSVQVMVRDMPRLDSLGRPIPPPDRDPDPDERR